jgi:hypothetical protein
MQPVDWRPLYIRPETTSERIREEKDSWEDCGAETTGLFISPSPHQAEGNGCPPIQAATPPAQDTGGTTQTHTKAWLPRASAGA